MPNTATDAQSANSAEAENRTTRLGLLFAQDCLVDSCWRMGPPGKSAVVALPTNTSWLRPDRRKRDGVYEHDAASDARPLSDSAGVAHDSI